jgi:hypothetical protein
VFLARNNKDRLVHRSTFGNPLLLRVPHASAAIAVQSQSPLTLIPGTNPAQTSIDLLKNKQTRGKPSQSLHSPQPEGAVGNKTPIATIAGKKRRRRARLLLGGWCKSRLDLTRVGEILSSRLLTSTTRVCSSPFGKMRPKPAS